ncbi:MAG: tRNA (adenosine(37)-N6)-threonylcarbamoyltransferase complex dimerization subunit type 1 TsaB, partial [Clostridia bacterium]|nr:tRNA (adenosine(37)-N6)-threonylcarbamoyltransferase complex dimerization subunit type 1 TsaB [Clostridia bacterium]
IGVATAKGLAFPGEIPCVPVSALAAMGQLCPPVEGVLCPCMDARRSQVYNALFEWRDGRLHRLAEDRALSVEALGQELLALGRPVWLTGDGAALCAAQFAATEAMKALPIRLAPEHSRHQRALGAALWAVAEGCEPIPPAELMPFYLRPPQAERERLARGGEPGMPPTRDYLV